MADDDARPLTEEDKRAAIERLHLANEDGRMDLAEVVLRTEEIERASTGKELAVITTDLPEFPSPAPGLPAVPAPPERSRRTWAVSIFGDVERSGSWRSGERFESGTLFGDVELDFRKASLTSGEAQVTAVTPFGDVDVLVPPGVDVEVSAVTLFGSRKVRIDAPAGPSAPVIRLRAFTVFGSVRVSSA
jgi:Cell wall-active antibiotics response 4TMS YvqF/Domain of unknown function (DUF1707)